ncbi:MAG: 6-phosphogluconolactonase [Gemmatimonadales bacterium]
MASAVIVVAVNAFAATAAARIADFIGSAVAIRGGCSLALCGGATPVPVFRQLVTRAVPWSEVAIFFGDERAVPPDHPASNFGMARRSLLDHVPVRTDRIHRMEAERTDRVAAAEDYAELLPPHLDVLLLGVGPDGHTASLFPGSAALSETGRRVVAVPPPSPPIEPAVGRMTITPPVIDAATQVVVLATGAGKAALLERILEGPSDPVQLPAQLARRGMWILDRAAAVQLHRRDD